MTGLMMFRAWLFAMALFVAAGPALAQNPISYVSNTGSNGMDCATPATACQTFGGALGKTANYGEIDCVGPGSYFGGTITQSVTIDCAAAMGFATFGGFTVNGAGIVVRLRNLSINRTGTGFVGIDAQSMAALYVENCVITNFIAVNGSNPPYLGIRFEPLAPGSQLFVTNTIISDNGFLGIGAGGGIQVAPQLGGSAGVTLDRVKLQGNVTGMVLNGNSGLISAVVRDSVISSNYANGIMSIGSQPVSLMIDNSVITTNVGTGVVSQGAGSTVTITRSAITGNGSGVSSQSGGVLQSFRDNRIFGNGTDGTPIAAVGMQ